MSSAADRLEDTFPHGTVTGYRDGCRDGNCPAPIGCRDVYRRYNGDFGFRRLVDAGVPLTEILRRDEVEREGIDQRDRAAARAHRIGTTPSSARAPRNPAAAQPKRQKPAPAPTPAEVDPLAAWQLARDAWLAQRKELYRVMRDAERAADKALADRDRAQQAFQEFVETGEPQKPEQPRRRQRRRSEIEDGIRRLHAAGLSDAEAAGELGITSAYAGIVRRDLKLDANVKRSAPRAPRTPRAPRQVLGHGTNASYARGCRCDDCKRAQRDYHRAWMASRRDNVAEISAEHHGTAYGYQLGCRSRKLCPSTPSCADASLAEERRRRREAGIAAAAPRVDAASVREHVRALMAGGMSVLAIADAAEVSKSGLKTLLYGRSGERKGEYPTEIEAEKAQRLLALEVSA